MMIIKMIGLILSLGFDTLIISMSLGLVKTGDRMRIALTFALAEAIMPLVGLYIGKVSGVFIGESASLVGGVILIGIAIWFIFFEDDDEEDQLTRQLIGWSLIATAFSIALDELAVGFTIGLIGVPVALTISLIAIQSFIFTGIGLSFGTKLKPFLGKWSEKLSGTILGLLGIWITVESIIHIINR